MTNIGAHCLMAFTFLNAGVLLFELFYNIFHTMFPS